MLLSFFFTFNTVHLFGTKLPSLSMQKKLQRVHNFALCSCNKRWWANCHTLLKQLLIHTLSFQCVLAKLILIYKYINKFSYPSPGSFFKPELLFPTNKLTFYPIHYLSITSLFSFTASENQNSLSFNVKEVTNIGLFKRLMKAMYL